ncbi:uncharacterized protein LOC124450905 [Xenia sp. Carnegie-2017]|uniref:uncharacterized protein LOC124450905 n=1 Tax=Xenia sp. Carnegie-2017 TaxID=2897299 RepID=UPI001F041537|nr:uncharacterized protein LOC124450905 [Xenia sp. Carnegie-2017]
MLEEVIGLTLSICSLFAADIPKVSSRNETLPDYTNFEHRELENDAQENFINKEFDDDNYNDELSREDLVVNFSSQNTTCYDDNLKESGKVWKTLWKCLWTNLNIIVASIIPVAFCITLVYVAMNTAYSCLEWQNHNNKTLPLSVKRAEVFGVCVEAIVLYLWFPFTMMILFGWREFKAKFLSTAYVGVIFGELAVMYHLISFQFNVYYSHSFYRYPTSVLFCVSSLCCTFVILSNIRIGKPFIPYSNCHIAALVLVEFIFCALLAYLNMSLIIPGFNRVRQNLYKFLIATSSPLVAFIPTALCRHMALRRSSEVVHPGRSFIMVSMIRGGVIFVYRTMQTDFKNIWIFIGLSLFSSVLNFLKKATKQIRFKMWKRIVSALNKLQCCQRLQILPRGTPHSRRLRADLEIQDILFEYNTLVLSQAYIVSYQLQSFDISTEPLLYEFLKRIAIGILIDFIFNCLTNFVQMCYYNIPIGRVWKKYWKRHLLANLIIVLVVIAYFGRGLESVFRSRFEETGESSVKYVIRNCSLF